MLLFLKFPWNTIVNRKKDLEVLISDTWTLTIFITLFALVAIFAIAQMIPNKANQADFRQRKIAFYSIGILFFLFIVGYNYGVVTPFIKKKAYILDFASIGSFGVLWQCALTFLVSYFLVSFALAKSLFKNGKFGTIFS